MEVVRQNPVFVLYMSGISQFFLILLSINSAYIYKGMLTVSFMKSLTIAETWGSSCKLPKKLARIVTQKFLKWIKMDSCYVEKNLFFIIQSLYISSQLITACHAFIINPSLAEHDMPCLSKQCGSRSVGF